MSLQNREDAIALIEKLVEDADENLAQEAFVAKKALVSMAKFNEEQFFYRLEDENEIQILEAESKRDDAFYARLKNWLVKFTAKNNQYGWKSCIAASIFVVGFGLYVVNASPIDRNLSMPEKSNGGNEVNNCLNDLTEFAQQKHGNFKAYQNATDGFLYDEKNEVSGLAVCPSFCTERKKINNDTNAAFRNWFYGNDAISKACISSFVSGADDSIKKTNFKTIYDYYTKYGGAEKDAEGHFDDNEKWITKDPYIKTDDSVKDFIDLYKKKDCQ